MVLKTLPAIFVMSALSACVHSAEAPTPSSSAWVTIFDGDSLSGWTPKIVGETLGQDSAGIFRVENGELHVSYQNVPAFENRFGHLFFEEELSDYRLRFDYRFFETQAPGGPAWAFMNSGVMVHAQAPDTMRKDQAFPVSVEAQLLGTSAATPERTTANICTPGTHIVLQGSLTKQHCINSETLAAAADDWISFELEVRSGDYMRLSIEGQEAFFLSQPEFDPADPDVSRLGLNGPVEQGFFALQAESHPVAFRNIELMRLD